MAGKKLVINMWRRFASNLRPSIFLFHLLKIKCQTGVLYHHKPGPVQ